MTEDQTEKVKAEWDKRVAEEDDVKLLDKELHVEQYGISPVSFARADRASFVGEVGKVRSDLVFHFWPVAEQFPPEFKDLMGDAFIEVFKFEEKLSADFVAELNSWAVKAEGFADNPWCDKLASKLFDTLQDKLDAKESPADSDPIQEC